MYAQSLDVLKTLSGMSANSIDKLSDNQMEQLMDQMNQQGLTVDQLDKQAPKYNLSKEHIAKLKKRIVRYNGVTENEYKDRQVQKKFLTETGTDEENLLLLDEERLEVFGVSTFRDTYLTFEPNLRLATPTDYTLGPDDELLIDLYGNSQANYNLFVSPEGKINIPYVGVVTVGGLTIEEAKSLIHKRLASVYSGINNNTVKVSIALGDIRSITVSVIGEIAKPGSYTIPSLSSVYNALYLSGGPTENASFRKVQVSRGNRIISVIDLYDFLVYGKSSTLRLKDQDVIKVLPYNNRVSIKGEIKTPAIYEMGEFETVDNLIEFAGGFTQNAYRDRVTAYRNTHKEKSVIDVHSSEYASFHTESGDFYTVGKILERFSNRVQIQGSVYRPGEYSLDKGMRVSDLLQKADGLLEDAFVNHAIIYRKNVFNIPEMMSFSPRSVLAGEADVALQKEDSVHIFAVAEMKEKEFISISGAVITPGQYTFAEGMTLKDVILMAKGFNSKADPRLIDVYRQTIDDSNLKNNVNKAEKFQFSMDSELNVSDSASFFRLKKNDRIMVRYQYGLEEMKKVSVVGEVKYPGDYVLLNKEQRISDLIDMAGGLTQYAYPNGAFLIRKRNLSKSEKRMLEDLSEQLGDKTTSTQGGSRDSLELRMNLIRETDMVGINLEKIIKDPKSKYDLLLSEGDSISIPQQLEVVFVDGEIMKPNAVRYIKGKSMKSYVRESGGFSARALKKGSYVIYANGEVDAARSFMGFRNYPKVLPGSRVIVPEKPEKKQMSTGEVVGLSASLASVAAIIISLFK